MDILLILSALGFLIAAYALYGYFQSLKSKSYRSLCDISVSTSCSKTFRSRYGKHLGIPNGAWGMGFYFIFSVLIWQNQTQYLFLLSITAVVVSSWLGYNLLVRIRTICLDCILIYLINLSLLGITGYYFLNPSL